MILEIQDLKFRYPKTKMDLLSIANFQMSAGEKVFLFGPSGAGKSTFLELLAGIQRPQSGRLRVAGAELLGMNESARDRHRAENLGFIFQSFNLLPFLSIQENIELGVSFSPDRRRRVRTGDLASLLERLGLQGLENRAAGELSVGQAQRVAAARAMYGRPSLILADEPTSALDHDHRESFLKILFELAGESGQAILFVSHDRSLASLFDRSVNLLEINQTSGGQP